MADKFKKSEKSLEFSIADDFILSEIVSIRQKAEVILVIHFYTFKADIG